MLIVISLRKLFFDFPIDERDLIRSHAEYAQYRRSVPMIVPFGRRDRHVGVTQEAVTETEI
jgi:hypothetical protein